MLHGTALTLILAGIALWAGVGYVLPWPRPKSILELLPYPRVSHGHACDALCSPFLCVQDGAERIWGHEKAVYTNTPGRMFRQWTCELGLTSRISATFKGSNIV